MRPFLRLQAKETLFFRQVLHALSKDASLHSLDAYVQHGETSCLWHSIAVAYYSYWFVRMFRIWCDEESLIKGALLHDYFLYDWHLPGPENKMHGFRHPRIALSKAKAVCSLNQIECNIIARHMFPLTPKPPRFRESIVVCLVDKICSIGEIVRSRPYGELKRDYLAAVHESYMEAG